MSKVDCPKFKNPPVVETVLTVQFDELQDFKTAHFGMFYETVKARFPEVIDRGRLDPVVETFPRGRMPKGAFQFITGDQGPGPQRVWYRQPDNGSMMLQLQPDRFAFNWAGKEGTEYPHYDSNRPVFIEEFENFSKFVNDHSIGKVLPNLCEVTYINHIYPEPEEDVIEFFESSFKGLKWETSDSWLKDLPELVAYNRVYVIGDEQGRLYVEANINQDKERKKFILLKITGRVIHKEEDSLLENMDLAHLWVVKSFVSLTEEHVQIERWKRF
ncbi:TIGR04255 family protein [Gimesia sp.]|uniref:TIGR04255 family protein n=1 Tax=Gimesia sp. TaxID=2024833 RepID=UPI0032EED7C6